MNHLMYLFKIRFYTPNYLVHCFFQRIAWQRSKLHNKLGAFPNKYHPIIINAIHRMCRFTCTERSDPIALNAFQTIIDFKIHILIASQYQSTFNLWKYMFKQGYFLLYFGK